MTTENLYKKSIRHGDLGLFLINELPKDLVASKDKVLLNGKSNKHYINNKGVFYPKDDGFVIGYLKAEDKCILYHDEHGVKVSDNKPKEVKLQKGVYELRVQHEIRHQSMEAVRD